MPQKSQNRIQPQWKHYILTNKYVQILWGKKKTSERHNRKWRTQITRWYYSIQSCSDWGSRHWFKGITYPTDFDSYMYSCNLVSDIWWNKKTFLTFQKVLPCFSPIKPSPPLETAIAMHWMITDCFRLSLNIT